VFLVNKLGNGKSTTNGTTPAPPATTAAPTGAVKAIDCKRMPGNTDTSVIPVLERQGFKVKRTLVDDKSVAGTVLEVPCSAPAGSEVEVKVSNGKGGGNPGPGGPGTTAPGDPGATSPGGGPGREPNPSCSGFLGNLGCTPTAAR
jgi:hypothetical protein